VNSRSVDKSDYERQLERDIANTTDEISGADCSVTLIVSGRGGTVRKPITRTLPWSPARSSHKRWRTTGSAAARDSISVVCLIPPDQKNPDAVMKLMAEYVTFPAAEQAGPPPPPAAMENTAVDSGFRRRLSSSGV